MPKSKPLLIVLAILIIALVALITLPSLALRYASTHTQLNSVTQSVSSLQTYVSAQDDFSVGFPSKPDIEDRQTGGRTYRSGSTNGAIYLVSTTPIPSSTPPLTDEATLQTYYAGVMNMGVQAYHGRIVSSSPITIDGRSAMRFQAEITIQGAKKLFDGMVVNANNWTYLLYITYPEGTAVNSQ